jgi:hypothetical protein
MTGLLDYLIAKAIESRVDEKCNRAGGALAMKHLLEAIGSMQPKQLLDLAVARLRAALPAGVEVASPRPLKFQLIPVHHRGSPWTSRTSSPTSRAPTRAA